MQTITTAAHLIEQKISDAEVQAFLKQIDASAGVREEDGSVFWDSKRSGLSLKLDGPGGTVTNVYMFPCGVDGYARYEGACHAACASTCPARRWCRPLASRTKNTACSYVGRKPSRWPSSPCLIGRTSGQDFDNVYLT